MNIRRAEEIDLKTWISLRQKLWPYHSLEELEADSRRILAESNQICFLLMEESVGASGFIEAAIYTCEFQVYCHVEGWYVEPQFRREGFGRELLKEVEHWALHKAIPILTSDTNDKYPASPAAHIRAGFRELQPIRVFVKSNESVEKLVIN